MAGHYRNVENVAIPPRLALFLALLGISSAAPLARLAGVNGFVAAWWRLTIGFAATLAIAKVSHARYPSLQVLNKVLPAGVLLGAHFALWLESLRHMSVSSSTGIVVSYPVIAGLYEALKGESKLVKLIGLASGFIGIALLSTPWAGASPEGAVLSFLASLAAAIYFIIGRSTRLQGISTIEYTLTVYGVASLFLSVLAAIFRVNVVEVRKTSIIYLVLLGLLPMLLGHSMMNYALGYYPVSRVTAIALLEPYGASLLAWLLLGEQPPALSIPGVLLTVAGAWLALK